MSDAVPFSGLSGFRLGPVGEDGSREILDDGNAPIARAAPRPYAGLERLHAAVSAWKQRRPRIVEVRTPDGSPLMSVGVPLRRGWGGDRSYEVSLPDGSQVGHVTTTNARREGLRYHLFGPDGQPVGTIGWFRAPLEVPGRGVNPRGRSRLIVDQSGAEIGRFTFTFAKMSARPLGVVFDGPAAPELPALCLAVELRPH